MYKKRSTAFQGFFLIESLVALAFLSVISFILIQFQLRIVMMQCDGLRQLKALSIAQNYIENWLLNSKKNGAKKAVLSTTTTTTKVPTITAPIITASSTVTKSNMQDSLFSLQAIKIPSNQLNNILLQVTVTWENPDKEQKSITLYAGACV